MKKLLISFLLIASAMMAQAQANIFATYNGDFENGFTSNWRFFDNYGAAGSQAAETNDAQNGTKAMQITMGDASASSGWSDRGFDSNNTHVPVTPGKFYNFSVYLKSNGVIPTVQCYVDVTYFDAANAYISSNQLKCPLTTSYTLNSLTTAAPSNAATCVVSFKFYDVANGENNKMAGVYYIDNVQLVEGETNNNLLTNGDFETGNLSAWTLRMQPVNIVPQSDVAISGDAHSGTYAGSVTWESNLQNSNIGDIEFDNFTPITAGTRYSFSIWAKSTTIPFILSINTHFASADWSSSADLNDNTFILSSTYAQHTFTFIAPANMAFCQPMLRAYNADGSRWTANTVVSIIDDAKLIKDTATSYIEKVATNNCKVYPNPVISGVINITGTEIKSASIYSVSGQKLKDINNKFTNINVSDLHSGIYYMKIMTEGAEVTQKLIVK